jgi:hypothetical protein
MRRTIDRFVSSLFTTRQPAPRARNRKARPGLDCLEGRQLLHGGAALPHHLVAPAAVRAIHLPPAPLPRITPGPSNVADMERNLTTDAPSYFYHGKSADQVNALLQQNNARLTGIQVEGTSPYTFTVTMVRNTGAFQKTSWWYYGLNDNQLDSLLTANNARLINVQSYEVRGSIKYAAVMVANTGLDNKAWWYYTDVTSDVLVQKIGDNHARIVDLQPLDDGHFNAIMVRNTGIDARPFWFYTGVSATDAVVKAQTNHAQITEFQRQSNGTYTVLMEGSPGVSWYAYAGKTDQQLVGLAQANHARLTRVQTYWVNGHAYFNGVMVVTS